MGPKKITCLKDGSYNADPPSCREIGVKKPDVVPLVLVDPKLPRNRDQGSRRPIKEDDSDRDFGVKRVRRPFVPGTGRPKFPREKFQPEVEREREVFSARPPIDNEIPDSANVQNSPAAGADVPQPVEGHSETRQAQLNLGKIIHRMLLKFIVYLLSLISY